MASPFETASPRNSIDGLARELFLAGAWHRRRVRTPPLDQDTEPIPCIDMPPPQSARTKQISHENYSRLDRLILRFVFALGLDNWRIPVILRLLSKRSRADLKFYRKINDWDLRTIYPNDQIGNGIRGIFSLIAKRRKHQCRWFNAEYYVQTYPEVAETGLDPLYHYLIAGRFQGHRVAPCVRLTIDQTLLALGVSTLDAADPADAIPAAAVGGNLRQRLSEQPRILDLLVIDHAIGGGANAYRMRVVSDAVASGQCVAELTYSHLTDAYTIRISQTGDSIECSCADMLDAFAALNHIIFKDILLNNIVVYKSTSATLSLIRDYASRTGANVTFAVHDFFCICPTVNLLNAQETFCNVPDITECRACIAHVRLAVPRRTEYRDIDAWRRQWAEFLQTTQELIFFSKVSERLVRKAYPQLLDKRSTVRPHGVDYLRPRDFALPFDAPPRVAVVGHITWQKGAKVVQALFEHIQQRGIGLELFVLGEVDRTLAPDVPALGAYQVEHLPRLLERHRVNLCLVPSIVPETFCFVAEELMNLRMPLAVFDLGAQAERVANYADGCILKRMEPAAIVEDLLRFYESLRMRYAPPC